MDASHKNAQAQEHRTNVCRGAKARGGNNHVCETAPAKDCPGSANINRKCIDLFAMQMKKPGKNYARLFEEICWRKQIRWRRLEELSCIRCTQRRSPRLQGRRRRRAQKGPLERRR